MYDKRYAAPANEPAVADLHPVEGAKRLAAYDPASLEAIGVPYRVIVEEQELSEYAAVVDRANILVLDRAYQDRYDTFDDRGDNKSKGPGPARNFAWDHAIARVRAGIG